MHSFFCFSQHREDIIIATKAVAYLSSILKTNLTLYVREVPEYSTLYTMVKFSNDIPPALARYHRNIHEDIIYGENGSSYINTWFLQRRGIFHCKTVSETIRELTKNCLDLIGINKKALGNPLDPKFGRSASKVNCSEFFEQSENNNYDKIIYLHSSVFRNFAGSQPDVASFITLCSGISQPMIVVDYASFTSQHRSNVKFVKSQPPPHLELTVSAIRNSNVSIFRDEFDFLLHIDSAAATRVILLESSSRGNFEYSFCQGVAYHIVSNFCQLLIPVRNELSSI